MLTGKSKISCHVRATKRNRRTKSASNHIFESVKTNKTKNLLRNIEIDFMRGGR